MKKIVFVVAALLITVSVFAQETADIGIWGGTSTYYGDVAGVPPFQSFKPNFGAYFRYNFNPRVGLRAMFLTGRIAADGNYQEVPWSFSKNVQDLSLQVEINYLKYRMGEKKTPFSPYILGGIGIAYFPYHLDPAVIYAFNPDQNKGTAMVDESVTALTLPFGFGVKTHFGERFGIGVEYLMRKMFVDKLDNLDDPLAYIDDKGFTHTFSDFLHNNDWSGYFGVHLTYKMYLGKEACPAYDSKYW
jgi:opacity protein-like surface antigen